MTEYRTQYNAQGKLEAYKVLHCTDGSEILELVAVGERAKAIEEQEIKRFNEAAEDLPWPLHIPIIKEAEQ